jgi:beta-carotene 3-hydroxylase
VSVSATVIEGIVVVAAFALMEPLTYAAHRWVMHGRRGWRWHASHHRASPGRFEKNDLFPVVFAAVVLALLAVGFNVRSAGTLVPVGVGVTLYGAVYALVHDGYIHRRFGRLRRRQGLERLAEAHALHHRFNGEPYGMLVPIIPRAVRSRAADRSGEPVR